MRFILAVGLLLAIAVPASAGTVAPRDAGGYVGQTVTVEGTVNQVVTDPSSRATFLDFGAAYPDMDFTAVIFPDYAHQFQGVGGLNGRLVDVSGVVQLYRGRQEIILNSPDQLQSK